MALEQDITIYKGAARAYQFAITQTDGTPEEMTGWEHAWYLRRYKRRPAILTKETGTGITLEDGSVTDTDTVARVQLDAEDSEDLVAGTYYHSLWRTDAGNEIPLAYGVATVEEH